MEFTYNNNYHSNIRVASYKAFHGRRCMTPLCRVSKTLKSCKLSPCFISPYQIIKKVDEVSYQIALPPILTKLHDIFHLDDVQVKDNLSYEVKPLKVKDQKIKQLRGKEILKALLHGN
ncbi:hypothetical protein CR513_31196, partial [Mucuna pruriens]